MTVVFSKKCEVALQSVLFLSTQSSEKYYSAKEISYTMHLPKEFVSKILQTLTLKGIIGSQKGKNGGFYLQKDPDKIYLIDIVEAIDGLEIFNKCILGFEGCSHSNPCPVHNDWGKLRENTLNMLKKQSLAELKEKSLQKIEHIG